MDRPSPEPTDDRVLWREEQDETRFVDLMKDIDGIVIGAARMYPGNSWTRGEIMQLFFLDLMTDKLHTIAHAHDDD